MKSLSAVEIARIKWAKAESRAPAVWPDSGGKWTAVIYLGVFPTAIAFFAWYEAMRLIKLSILNVMQYLTPIFTIALAWALLGETIAVWQLTGIAVVMVGIFLVSHAKAGCAKKI